MAPELGLFLDEAYFDAYNKQWGDLHGALALAPWQAAADEFKVRQPRKDGGAGWADGGAGWAGAAGCGRPHAPPRVCGAGICGGSSLRSTPCALQAGCLYPHIVQRDREEGVNLEWLRTLNEANYRFR